MKQILVMLLILFFLAGCSNSSPAPLTSITVLPSSTLPSSPSPESTESIQALLAKRKEVYNVSVSPNGEILALSASYGVQIYSLETKVLLYTFENTLSRFQGVYSQIAWSPDSNYIAVGTLNFGVRIWEVASWNLLTATGVEESYTSAVFSHPGFAWSPNSDQLVLGINPTGLTPEDYESGKLLLWDKQSNSWNLLKEGLVYLSGVTWNTSHTGVVPEKADIYDYVVWSPDEKHFYGHFDLGGDVFDLETDKHEFNICCYAEVAWSADGRYFAATPEGGSEISIWDTKENILLSKEVQGEYIYALAWTPKGELLAVGLRNGKNVLWNASTKIVVM